MNPHNKLRYLIALSLLAMFVSVFSFASQPAAAATASGKALVARNFHNPTANDPTYDYHLWAMDATGNINPIAIPATASKAPLSTLDGKPLFVFFVPPDRIEVIDLVKGTDRFYPAPPDPSETLIINPQAPTPYPTSAVMLAGGKQLLFGGDTDTWYVLDLASGRYTTIDLKPLDLPGRYYPFAQSSADGMIYANWGCRCDAPPAGVARYDLHGNGKVLDLHLGKYAQANLSVTVSPAGRYLYFAAKDPDQAMPPHAGPGVDANVLLRYRISDGTTQVIARAAPDNLIGDYTLTSNDPYITYSEIVPMPYKQGDYNWTVRQTFVKRVNLATLAAPQTLLSATAYHLLWCGNTLYYGTFDNGKTFTHSYSPITHKTHQAEGQLLGCTP